MIAGLLLGDVSLDRRDAYALFHTSYIFEDLCDGQLNDGNYSLSHCKTFDHRVHNGCGQRSFDVAPALDNA